MNESIKCSSCFSTINGGKATSSILTGNPLIGSEKISLFGFFDQTIFHIAAYVIAVTAIIASVYLCAFFIKKLIGLFTKK